MLKETLKILTGRGPHVRHSDRQRLRQKLAMQRPMSSLIDRELAAASDEIVLEREDWVEAFVDYGHAVSFDGGETIAFRAVTLHDGTLFWNVRRDGKTKG